MLAFPGGLVGCKVGIPVSDLVVKTIAVFIL